MTPGRPIAYLQDKYVIRGKKKNHRIRAMYDARKAHKALYPKNWMREIVPLILARDGYRCRVCGIERYAVGEWQDGQFIRWRQGGSFLEAKRIAAVVSQELGRKQRVVLLACAHVLNPDPSDVRNENLLTLCNYHHTRLDTPLRQVGISNYWKLGREAEAYRKWRFSAEHDDDFLLDD